MQERRNSIANAPELCLSCINPLIWHDILHNMQDTSQIMNSQNEKALLILLILLCMPLGVYWEYFEDEKHPKYRAFAALHNTVEFYYSMVQYNTILTYSLITSQIAKFMGPTWGRPGSCRPQMGPMLVPWTLLSGLVNTLDSDAMVTQGARASTAMVLT